MQPTQLIGSLAELLAFRQRQRRLHIAGAAVGCLVFGAALAFIAGALWQFVLSVGMASVSLVVVGAVVMGVFDHERRAVDRARTELRRLDEHVLAERWQAMYVEFQRDRSLASAAFLRAIELERPGGGTPTVVGGSSLPPDSGGVQ